MKRDFDNWLSTFRKSISDYKYYVDFHTVYENAEKYKDQFNLLNGLIKSKDIEKEFLRLLKEYPKILECIPTLLAVRECEIFVLDKGKEYNFNFKKANYKPEEYATFMQETGLFDLFKNHLINNCYDYVIGVEAGLNSNARKNRGGHLMEDLVEKYIIEAGFIKGDTYFKEMYTSDMEKQFGIDLKEITNQVQQGKKKKTEGKKNKKTEKRFDYVIRTNNYVYGIETNFYASGGSKLNETARSYKMITEESKKIKGFKFVWFTDGDGWDSAKNNLRETFDVLDDMYNIKDMEDGIMKKIFL